MPTEWTNTLESAFDQAHQIFGGFTFKFDNDSTVYRGVQGENLADLQLVTGGFLATYAFTIHARKKDFTTIPAIGSKLTVLGRKYRLAGTGTSDGDTGIKFVCGDVNS